MTGLSYIWLFLAILAIFRHFARQLFHQRMFTITLIFLHIFLPLLLMTRFEQRNMACNTSVVLTVRETPPCGAGANLRFELITNGCKRGAAGFECISNKLSVISFTDLLWAARALLVCYGTGVVNFFHMSETVLLGIL